MKKKDYYKQAIKKMDQTFTSYDLIDEMRSLGWFIKCGVYTIYDHLIKDENIERISKKTWKIKSEKSKDLNYLSTLTEIYFKLKNNKDKSFSFNDFCIKKGISKNIPNALKKLKLVNYSNGLWTWIGDVFVTEQNAEDLKKELVFSNPPRESDINRYVKILKENGYKVYKEI